jgi:hypothetical protein
MNRKVALSVVAISTMLSAFATLIIGHIVQPPGAAAQQAGSPLAGLTVFANTYGLSSQKFDAFIFLNQQTGDIWIYRDEKLGDHYRVVAMGQPLQKIKG